VSVEYSICRLSRNGRPVGLGFAVGREHVVTCAHVVNKAHQTDESLPTRELEQANFPDTGVTLAVEFVIGSYWATASSSDRVALTASLTRDGWVPSDPARFAADDVAVLRLAAPVPSFVPEVRARRARSGDAVQVFGPVAGRTDGGHVVGEVIGEVGSGRVQLNADGQGFRVRPGFSGGPVWRRDSGEIVGMLVACGLGDTAVDAYILDVACIGRVWSAWRAANLPDQGPQFHADMLRALNAEEASRRLAALPLDDAVRALPEAPVATAAEVLESLLSDYAEVAVALLAHARRNKARELIAAIASAPPWLRSLPEAADAISQYERNNRSRLGERAGPVARADGSKCGTEGYYRAYRKGQVYWTSRGGAQATWGEIGERHIAMGGSGSKIGFPLTSEQPAQESPFRTSGVFQRFESDWNYLDGICGKLGLVFGASIYWSRQHGARATWGGIGEHYEDNGGTGGPFGFPITGEMKVEPCERKNGDGADGWLQRFEGGVIYWSEQTGAIAVASPIAECYERHRGLGFPVTPLVKAAANEEYGTEGSYQRFEAWEDYRDILPKWSDPGGATIYTSDKYGTYCVAWGVGAFYENLGGTSGSLGFPCSDETDARVSEDEPRSVIQEFEGGAIFWKQDCGSVSVSRPIMNYFSQHSDHRQRLGFPIKEAIRINIENDDGMIQFFEQGVVTVLGQVVEVWVRAQELARE
jgi:uncharacterized protein with LGFP repeats